MTGWARFGLLMLLMVRVITFRLQKMPGALLPVEHSRIIEYSDMDTDRLRDLFRRIPKEAFWGMQEIEPDMFDLARYVDYFSKSWSPKFYPGLMLAAQSEQTGEYLGLIHIVMEGKRAAITGLCTHLQARREKSSSAR
jgi:hypothetical protein